MVQRTKKQCSIDGCESESRARGFCQRHYQRWHKHGDPHYTHPYSKAEVCSVEGCGERKRLRVGLCNKHYSKKLRYGNPLASATPKPAPTTEETFWDRVVVKDGCWEWDGHLNKKGYAVFKLLGKTYMAHRVSYEIHVGKIPAGLEIDHKCRTRGCTKPSHLQAVTHAENMQNLSSRNPVSKAGYRGVSYNKRLKKWVAIVRYRGEFYYLGLHSNPEDAAQAALDKRMELFTNNQEDRSEQIA